MKDTLQLIAGILIVAFVVIIIGLSIAGFVSGIIHWNHGICPECEHEYTTNEFLDNGNSWIEYKCENCGSSYMIPEMLK